MNHFRNILASLLLLPALAAVGGSALDGKSGRNLLNAIAASWRPSTVAMTDNLELMLAFGSRDNAIYSPWDGEWHPLDQWGGFPDDGTVAMRMVNMEWWAYAGHVFTAYGDTIRADMHNFLAGSSTVVGAIGLWPVAEVTTTLTDCGLWRTGTLTINGTLTNGWEPPAEIRGDVARKYFYMCVLWPAYCWEPWAHLNFTDDPWPGIASYTRATLMKWHRDDPPDERELRSNALCRQLQGNGNPFVELPELAEYLWGYYEGEVYDSDPDTSPLRSTYSLTTDTRINLQSPWVPDDAWWFINGKRLTSSHISPSDLGTGLHELTYITQASQGKVTIQITK